MEEKKIGLSDLIKENLDDKIGVIVKRGPALEGLNDEEIKKLLDEDHEKIKDDYRKMGIII
jgi:hypothetical protein